MLCFIVFGYWWILPISFRVILAALELPNVIILRHHSAVIMNAVASQITGVSIVCSTVCSATYQRKHQSSAPIRRQATIWSNVGMLYYGYMRLSASMSKWPIWHTLQWHHNKGHDVSNHRHFDGLLKPLFRCTSKKNQSSASLAFVRGFQRWPMDSPHKGPVTRKIFPFDDFIM